MTDPQPENAPTTNEPAAPPVPEVNLPEQVSGIEARLKAWEAKLVDWERHLKGRGLIP
jgi:hypothetical protein